MLVRARWCTKHMVQVKCDETKPACGRCTTTGRKCDGYASPDIQNKTPTADGTALVMAEPSRGPAVCSINASAGEMLGLEFFCVKLAPSMGTVSYTHLTLPTKRIV